MMELSRQMHIKEHGTLKGFGETAKFYRADWRGHFPGGYKAAFESEIMKELRAIFGM